MHSLRWIVFLAVVLVTNSLGAEAQDHLVPDGSVIGDSEASPNYPIIVRDVLSEAYDRDAKARMIEEPSFEPELAVALKEDKGAYRIVTLRPVIQLWAYESLAMMKRGEVLKLTGGNIGNGTWGKADKEIADLEKALPANIHDVKVARCEIAIDADVGKRILDVWTRMLLATRFVQKGEPSVFVTDGVIYHFSALGDFEFLAGQTHSPDENTSAGMLVAAGDAMSTYCDKRDASAAADLNAKISRLAERLRSNPQL